MTTTNFYNTTEKKEAFRSNVAGMVANGLTLKAAILTEASIDLFCSNLLANVDYLEETSKAGNLDLAFICNLASEAAAEAGRAIVGL